MGDYFQVFTRYSNMFQSRVMYLAESKNVYKIKYHFIHFYGLNKIKHFVNKFKLSAVLKVFRAHKNILQFTFANEVSLDLS